ncbi:MAG TPA: hypothetical protein V6D25_10255 [Leptolyngbyaceae cyanobacterium]
MSIMTAEEMEEQKIRESLIELPTNPEEMKNLLKPEELEQRNLPFPETDFLLPGIGVCCVEIIKVFYYPGESGLFVRLKTDQEQDEFHSSLRESREEMFDIPLLENSSPAFDPSIIDRELPFGTVTDATTHEQTEAWVKREDVSLAEWLGLWDLVVNPD